MTRTIRSRTIRSTITRSAPYALLCALLLTFVACTPDAGPPPPQDVLSKALAAPDVMILDVRPAGAYADGHVPGAVNIPLEHISSIADVVTDKNRPIVVHCGAGVRSGKATRTMHEMGYTNILDAKSTEAVRQALGVALAR